jgi:hypothetical protein
MNRAIAIGLDYLHHLGIDWPLQPTEEQVRSEYERILSRLGSREIEEVMDFPLMSEPHVYRDSGCSDQGIELCSVYGYESFCPGRLWGG